MKTMCRALVASLVVALVSCSGGGGGDDGGGGGGGNQNPTGPGTVSGTALNSSTGAAASGVTVSVGSQTTTTNSQGAFTLSSVPAGNAVVTLTSNNFAMQARPVTVASGATTSVDVQMVPVAATVAFTPSVGGTLSVPGSTASVTLPAGGMVTSSGAAPSGSGTARLTPINPTLDPELMPGTYQVVSGNGTAQIESFGAFDMTFSDAAGNALNLASGQSATIRIPVASRSGSTPPPTIPLMYFNPSTGLWVQEGTATLQGTAPNQFYQGAVTHFSNWNADQIYNTSNITVCVRDSANQPVSGVRVTSDGIDYSGTASATTNAQGVAVVAMKRSAQATITARLGTRVSNTITISASQSAANFNVSTCLALGGGGSTAGLTVRLTWGANPSDLDSHLRGPNNIDVAWDSRGSLTALPFAQLDVDDITGFGPEVITVTRLARGTYTYYVHKFSGTGTQTGSPARVELRFGSQTQIFTPGPGELSNTPYWRVFSFTVNNDCSVTFTTLQTWSSTEPTVPAQSTQFCNTTSQLSDLALQEYGATVVRARAAAAVKPDKE